MASRPDDLASKTFIKLFVPAPDLVAIHTRCSKAMLHPILSVAGEGSARLGGMNDNVRFVGKLTPYLHRLFNIAVAALLGNLSARLVSIDLTHSR